MIEAVPAKDLFVWSSRFETGIREVDQQHARLVQIINRLGDQGQVRPFDDEDEELMTVFSALSSSPALNFQITPTFW